MPVGPPLQMKIAREDLIKQMETNGFRLVKEHTFLPYQYFLRVRAEMIVEVQHAVPYKP